MQYMSFSRPIFCLPFPDYFAGKDTTSQSLSNARRKTLYTIINFAFDGHFIFTYGNIPYLIVTFIFIIANG